jgi:hypothetical protein
MTEEQQGECRHAMAEPDGDEWAPCYCCGWSYLTATMVPLPRHPDEALCVDCVSQLHDCSRPIARKLHPTWELPAHIRQWITSVTSHEWTADGMFRKNRDEAG